MKKEQFLSIVRHLVSAFGGIATVKGWGNDELILQLSGTIMMLASVIWGVASKKV